MMERMTEKHYLENGYYMKCSEHCNNEDVDCVDCAALDNLVDRLGAYEDTELTPEEVLVLKNNLVELARLLEFECNEDNARRMLELVRADKDGRLVVLPCKVGDTIYEVSGARIYESVLRRILF